MRKALSALPLITIFMCMLPSIAGAQITSCPYAGINLGGGEGICFFVFRVIDSTKFSQTPQILAGINGANVTFTVTSCPQLDPATCASIIGDTWIYTTNATGYVTYINNGQPLGELNLYYPAIYSFTATAYGYTSTSGTINFNLPQPFLQETGMYEVLNPCNPTAGYSCQNNNLYFCPIAGQNWTLSMNCVYGGEVCQSSTYSGTCVPPNQTAPTCTGSYCTSNLCSSTGQYLCANQSLYYCQQSGAAWAFVQNCNLAPPKGSVVCQIGSNVLPTYSGFCVVNSGQSCTDQNLGTLPNGTFFGQSCAAGQTCTRDGISYTGTTFWQCLNGYWQVNPANSFPNLNGTACGETEPSNPCGTGSFQCITSQTSITGTLWGCNAQNNWYAVSSCTGVYSNGTFISIPACPSPTQTTSTSSITIGNVSINPQAPISTFNQTDFAAAGWGWILPFLSPMFFATILVAGLSGVAASISKGAGLIVGSGTFLSGMIALTVFGIYPPWIGIILVILTGFIFLRLVVPNLMGAAGGE